LLQQEAMMGAQSKSFVFFVLRALLQTELWTLGGALPLDPRTENGRVSRRGLLTWPLGLGGAIVYGKLVSDTVQKLSRGELVYPESHEQRVSATIAVSMKASIPPQPKLMRPLRVLEVGIGKECRVIRRNLYNEGYKEMAASGVAHVDWFGVDISSPSETAKEQSVLRLRELGHQYHVQTSLNFLEASISQPLDFPDGYFDCMISSLTLCSVDDQSMALQEIRRLLRPDGGAFGYIEHTAVLPDEPYRLLELQQKLFDPLQQAVADNCHLHRYTDSAILEVFGAESKLVTSERFLVGNMWPVSCQACGVIQRVQA
jgi:SAM-dependent methyltransferase